MESKIEDMRGPQETKLQEIVQQKESIMRELEKMYQTQRDLKALLLCKAINPMQAGPT